MFYQEITFYDIHNLFHVIHNKIQENKVSIKRLDPARMNK